jgi:predicted HicB family RNase H-like nuclease
MAAFQQPQTPQGPVPQETHDPQRVITVRLPKSLLDGLKVQAHRREVSLNKMCVDTLKTLIPPTEVSQEIPSCDGPASAPLAQ